MKITWLVIFVLAVTGCSRPQDTVIPSDMTKWDAELAPQVKRLGAEDQKLAVGYVMRAKMGSVLGGKDIPFGTTLGDAIAQQKQWLADQAAQEKRAAELKAQVERDEAEQQARIGKAVTVSLIAKQQLPRSFEARRFSDEQVFKIAVKNTSDKEIVGVSGAIDFIDLFDKKVGGVTFRISERLAPGAGTVWTGSRDYNQFVDEHKAVWNLEEGKYKTRFTPDTIVFADGTKLSVTR